MRYLLRAAWWKIRPPLIPSPYLHNPRFARELEDCLAACVCRRQNIIAFGHLYGFTTDIIKRNKDPSATLTVYDINPSPGVIEMNIWRWLANPLLRTPFDFLYVDVGNSEALIVEMWHKLQWQMSEGAAILFEGCERFRMTLPHKKLVISGPGVGLLVP